jgi:putative hydrolase of the HAD superfamily
VILAGDRSVIRAVTFDAAGTLIAPRERVAETYARFAAAHGIVADPRTLHAAFRRAFRAAPAMAFPGAAPNEVEGLERRWWRAVVADTLGPVATAHPSFDACFDALFAHYASAAAWTLFADVPPALQALRDRGLRIGVVSNFDGRLPAILDGLGVGADAVVWSTRAGAAKPARAIFAAAASALGVPLDELCHVGDDVEADVRGARAAGARAIHVDRPRAIHGDRPRAIHEDRPGSAEGLTTLVARLDRLG